MHNTCVAGYVVQGSVLLECGLRRLLLQSHSETFSGRSGLSLASWHVSEHVSQQTRTNVWFGRGQMVLIQATGACKIHYSDLV